MSQEEYSQEAFGGGVYLHANWVYQCGLDRDQIPVLDPIVPMSPSDCTSVLSGSIIFDKRQESLQLI